MSRHESPEIGDMIARMLNALVRRAAEGDGEALEALQAIEHLAPRATNAGLALAHEGKGPGYSYAFLADLMGTSRPAVMQRVARAEANAVAAGGVCHLACVGMKRCRA